jgi:hypothetical protein
MTLPRPPVSPYAAVVLFLLIASRFPLLHKACIGMVLHC